MMEDSGKDPTGKQAGKGPCGVDGIESRVVKFLKTRQRKVQIAQASRPIPIFDRMKFR